MESIIAQFSTLVQNLTNFVSTYSRLAWDLLVWQKQVQGWTGLAAGCLVLLLAAAVTFFVVKAFKRRDPDGDDVPWVLGLVALAIVNLIVFFTFVFSIGDVMQKILCPEALVLRDLIFAIKR